jgi:hypothetical protein
MEELLAAFAYCGSIIPQGLPFEAHIIALEQCMLSLGYVIVF